MSHYRTRYERSISFDRDQTDLPADDDWGDVHVTWAHDTVSRWSLDIRRPRQGVAHVPAYRGGRCVRRSNPKALRMEAYRGRLTHPIEAT